MMTDINYRPPVYMAKGIPAFHHTTHTRGPVGTACVCGVVEGGNARRSNLSIPKFPPPGSVLKLPPQKFNVIRHPPSPKSLENVHTNSMLTNLCGEALGRVMCSLMFPSLMYVLPCVCVWWKGTSGPLVIMQEYTRRRRETSRNEYLV